MKGLTPTEHRALKAIAVQFFVNGAVIASYIPRLPSIRDQLEVSLGTIGVILAVATGFGVAGSIIQGPIVNRFGTRNTMIYGSISLVLFLPFVGWSPTWWLLLLTLSALSICDVIVDVAMNLQGSTLSARRDVSVMNRLHGTWSLGTVVGALIATLMAILEVDLRLHLLGAAVFLLATLLYVGPGLLTEDQAAEPDNDVAPEEPSSVRSATITFAILGGAAILPEMINSDWAAFRLSDDLGTSAGLSAVGYVAFTSGMLTGRFAGDWVVTRYGQPDALRWSSLLAVAGTLTAMTIPLVASVLVGLFIAGLGASIMLPQLYDKAAQNTQSASALGGLTAGSRCMLLIAPLVVGFMADTEAMNVGAAILVATIPGALLVGFLSTRILNN